MFVSKGLSTSLPEQQILKQSLIDYVRVAVGGIQSIEL